MEHPANLYEAILALERAKAEQPPTAAEIAQKAAEIAKKLDTDAITRNAIAALDELLQPKQGI